MKRYITVGLIFFMFISYIPILKAQYKAGYKERGVISYYTDRFSDRKTANGEKFDNTNLVGCHPVIPFNSKVKVTNLANGKSVIVRINDRGPYAYGRMMDISKAAAQKIDLIATGTAKVEIELLPYEGEETSEATPTKPTEKTPSIITSKNPEEESKTFLLDQTYSQWGTLQNPTGYTIQLIGYSTAEKAQEYCKMLRSKGFEDEKIFIRAEASGDAILYKVLLGVFETKEDSLNLQKKYLQILKKKGYVRTFER
jgi:rare lipoprotein A